MNAIIFLCLVLPIIYTECQKMVKVNTYKELLSYLSSGADVRYYFDTSTCGNAPTRTPNITSPVFGGQIKLFTGSQDLDEYITLSQVRYIDNGPKNLTEEIQTTYILNDTAMVMWKTTGFFVNKTELPSGLYCNWTRGEGSIWVKEHPEQKQMTSFNEIESALKSGENVRWIANIIGCKCPYDNSNVDDDDCNDAFFGDKITDFKISDDGSIKFASSSTILLPLEWSYVRMIAFGHIYQNNTVNFQISYLYPTTWEDGEDDPIYCPIAQTPQSKGVGFFV